MSLQCTPIDPTWSENPPQWSQNALSWSLLGRSGRLLGDFGSLWVHHWCRKGFQMLILKGNPRRIFILEGKYSKDFQSSYFHELIYLWALLWEPLDVILVPPGPPWATFGHPWVTCGCLVGMHVGRSGCAWAPEVASDRTLRVHLGVLRVPFGALGTLFSALASLCTRPW